MELNVKAQDLVVLVDETGAAVGTAQKSTVHTTTTALHRAFSCHLFDAEGRVLSTRRALTKIAWPGVWTNAFCGHPRPGESDIDAIIRRAAEELGARVRDIRPLLPDFRYRAVDDSGIVENEICPVYSAVLDSDLSPNPEEVAAYAWSDPSAFSAAITATPWAFSPWLAMQNAQLSSPVGHPA